MKKVFTRKIFTGILQAYLAILIILYLYGFFKIDAQSLETNFGNIKSLPANSMASSIFIYSFNTPGVLYESNDMDNSRSKYWWLNSGGSMMIEDGVGKTIQGDLSPWNRWRIAYGLNNPTDTDNGLHPQNVFRLFTRNTWENFSEQIYFKINKDNLSNSPNRNISNGIFLISRFRDRNNLYYAGVRVDGTAVIKKKVGGTYFTIAQKEIWDGRGYDRDLNPSLLPKNSWIGMRSEISSSPSGSVSIKFFLDTDGQGDWQLIFDETDDGKTYGGSAILGSGSGGLRSDFMDIEFRGFEVREAGSFPA